MQPPKSQVLSLSHCHLQCPICESLSYLSLLSKLDLDGNNLSINVSERYRATAKPEDFWFIKKYALFWDLAGISSRQALKSLVFMLLEFYGEIPDSIGNLQFFYWTGLKESYSLWIDTFFSSLTHLIHLKLSCNKLLGWIPFLPPLKKGPRVLLDTINHVGLANPGSLSTESSSMEATLNSSLFELPSLERLLPSQNSLGGVLQDF